MCSNTTSNAFRFDGQNSVLFNFGHSTLQQPDGPLYDTDYLNTTHAYIVTGVDDQGNVLLQDPNRPWQQDRELSMDQIHEQTLRIQTNDP